MRPVAGLVVVVAVLVGCGERNADPDAGVPNPAAVFCEEQGGTVLGPEPMCEPPDGTVVDAWEQYRSREGSDGPG